MYLIEHSCHLHKILFVLFRLRQEIAHPAGVRLTLRKRDCQNSLALVEIFGCLWVAGWKQRDYPILFNAFHVGDQILSVAGQPVRNASDFNKLVKSKTSNSVSNAGEYIVPNISSQFSTLNSCNIFSIRQPSRGFAR